MNTIIGQLSQIEQKSEDILANGAEKKKALTEEYAARLKYLDNKWNENVNNRLNSLKEEMDMDIDLKLKEQDQRASDAIHRLERHYDQNHAAYVEQLFQKITEV